MGLSLWQPQNVLLIWIAPSLFVTLQAIDQADILLASDPRWSDVDGEDVNLQAGFEKNGWSVSKMSGFTTGSLSTHLSGHRGFVYPKAEVAGGQMSSYFNDADYDGLFSWIEQGGSLLAVMHADSIHLMNAGFGWSIHHRQNQCNSPAARVGHGWNNGVELPDHLVELNRVYSVKVSTLPSEATCLYLDADCCWVFVANVGAGVVAWLGFDWHYNVDSSELRAWNKVASMLIDSAPVDCVLDIAASAATCTDICGDVPGVGNPIARHGGEECSPYTCQPGDGACRYADAKSCHWISIDLTSKDIQGSNFFGFECPSREFIAAIQVQRYTSQSHLHNSPVEVECCEISGTHHVTDTCVDKLTLDVGTAEDALCEGNAVISGVYNYVNPLIPQNMLEYDQTMAHRCCEVSECEAEYCNDGNGLSIDESSCITIGHENEPRSDEELSTLSCPSGTVLKKIIDADVAIGVQQVHEIECCELIQVAPPTSSPSTTPSQSPSSSPSSKPSQAPITACMSCILDANKESFHNIVERMRRFQECLENYCFA